MYGWFMIMTVIEEHLLGQFGFQIMPSKSDGLAQGFREKTSAFEEYGD
jgi:hypothetical protein